jgi:hypothetical protein
MGEMLHIGAEVSKLRFRRELRGCKGEAFAGHDCVGDLYHNYQYFVGDFRFGKWLAG